MDDGRSGRPDRSTNVSKRMNRLKIGRRLLLAVGGLVLLSGCSGGGDGEPAANELTKTTTAAKEKTGGKDSSIKVDKLDPNNVLAKQTVSMRDNPQDTVDFGLQSLTVEGSIATLRLVVTPHFKSESADKAISLFDIYRPSILGFYLLDRKNLKRYDIVRDGPKLFASDSVGTETVNGTPMAAYAVFAAPQDEVPTIDVFMADYWPEFKNVPVKR